jgi:hypothetical protein
MLIMMAFTQERASMADPAVEFNIEPDRLILIYRPQQSTEWVRRLFKDGKTLTVKGTFELTRADLASDDVDEAEPYEGDVSLLDMDDVEFGGEDRMDFVVATAEGEYFRFHDSVLPVGVPVFLHRSARPTWKWFSAERRVSILRFVAELGLERIVIGGDAPGAIPLPEYERMLQQLPTPWELKRYVLARVGAVVGQFADPKVDAEALLHAYVDKRVAVVARDMEAPFREFDVAKYAWALERLQAMLRSEDAISELQWQNEIVQIVLLLNPKYIKAFTEVRLWDGDKKTWRRIDILLVDASGNVDVIEIKKPFGKSIVLSTQYRDHHLPMRELVGAMGQVGHYLRHLNRWGSVGEECLTEQLHKQLPKDFKIRIINPSGIVIMGRDNELSEDQERDFEVMRRDSKSVIDVITYDDLLRRLQAVLDQLRSGPAISRAPAP